jgi:hypothetical protein
LLVLCGAHIKNLGGPSVQDYSFIEISIRIKSDNLFFICKY